MFHPEEARLRKAVEAVVNGLPTIGRELWPEPSVGLRMHLVFGVRRKEHRHISENYVSADVKTCRGWLAHAVRNSGKWKEEIALRDIMELLPQSMRT